MAHSYWRLHITTNNGAADVLARIYEIQFRPVAGTTYLASGGSSFATTSYSGYPSSSAFDNNTGTSWLANSMATQDIGYHYTSAINVLEVYILSTAEGGWGPKDFTIDFSDDGTTWTTQATVTNTTGWVLGTPKLFSVPAEQNNILPSLLAHAHTIYAPTVRRSGDLLAPLITRSHAFYTPTVHGHIIYQAKSNAQYSLPLAAVIRQASGNAQHSLYFYIHQETSGSAQQALNAYQLQQSEGSAQHALSIYHRFIAQGSAQHDLAGWLQAICKGSSQHTLNAYQQLIAQGSAQHLLNGWLQATCKGSAQYALPVYQQSIAKGSAQYGLPGWLQAICKGSSQHALNAYRQSLAQGSAQHLLNGWLQATCKGSAQYALPVYQQSIAKGSAQYGLPGWLQAVGKGSSQHALNAYRQSLAQGSAQYGLAIYELLQAQGIAQYDLSAYTVFQAAGSAQHSLYIIVEQRATGSAQWLLDSATKYYGYALNLTTGALSKLDNFEFNSLAGNLGADADGIYTLTGISNNGVAIPAFIETGTNDFKDSHLKRFTDAYIAKEGSALTLTVTTDNCTVPYSFPSTSSLQTVKKNLARGAKGRFVKIKVENVAGSAGSIESIELNTETLSRKV